ncbi:MAG: DEAD/DEAH box helicase [Myxococcota bacterium]
MSNEAFAGIPAPLVKALEGRGFTELTAVQRAVVDADAEGRDLRISSQTGSGKTVAFGLALAAKFLRESEAAAEQGLDAAPAAKGRAKGAPPSGPAGWAKPAPATRGGKRVLPTALVIVPTRELAMQVREELAWLYAHLRGFSVAVVTGGTSIPLERRSLAAGPNLVVGTPGRLLDHMRSGALSCHEIEHVILDEADQMLDMGFREELEGILDQLPKDRSSHLVSATFQKNVQALANRYQRNALTLEGTKLGVANADIQHIAYSIRRHETYPALVNVLLLAGDSRCLLFVNRRVDATDLAEKLSRDGFGAAPFSGELPQAQRTRTLNAFRNGTLPILVSTDVAARGIDVPDISTVIHVDPPRNPDSYVHRSGRTGRAGNSGRSILMVVGPETRRVTRMLQSARIEVSFQPVPQPEKVQKALLKQARRMMHERLAEDQPTETQMMYAKQLLEERDPVAIVATLLEMAKPKPPCEPKAVEGLDPFADNRPGRRGGRDARDSRGPAGRRDERPQRGGRPGARGDSGPPTSFTPFTVSWGQQTGATTGRLLSHICRRGGVESHQVGAIKINSKSSTVDIATDIADNFASRAKTPDKREPGITIRRATGKVTAGPRGGDQGAPRKGGYSKPHQAGHQGGYQGGQGGGGKGAGRGPGGPGGRPGANGGSPPSGPARDNRRGKPSGRPPHRRASR